MKNLEYHDLYVQINTLLLAAVYENDDDIADRHLFFFADFEQKMITNSPF